MSNQAWGGALLGVGSLSVLGGVAEHSQNGKSLVNPATVIGAAGVGTGLYLVTRKSSGRSRARSSAASSVTRHNPRRRYRGH